MVPSPPKKLLLHQKANADAYKSRTVPRNNARVGSRKQLSSVQPSTHAHALRTSDEPRRPVGFKKAEDKQVGTRFEVN